MIDLTLPEVQFAMQAVRKASQLVRQVQQTMVTPALTKDDRSPVTVADFASQAIVGRLLSQSFPEDLLVAEENSADLRKPEAAELLSRVSDYVSQAVPGANSNQVCQWIDFGRANSGKRFWTLDPIDGTKGFLRGEQYVVALALVENGQVQVAALGCPNLVNASQPLLGGAGSLILAVRDQGAWTTPLVGDEDFQKLHTSTIQDPAQARVLRSVKSGHTNIGQIDQFAQVLGLQAPPVSMDSQGKYALLAAGSGELYLRLLSPDKPNYREKIWDQAAGSLVLQESGGMLTDLDGKQLDFSTGRSLINNRGILASNGLLHPAALHALRTVGA